ncbi:hypothetical protein Fmac_018022 [Flemingia macrophylla]|uniref:FHA domain-containing protein n=1 Tax=Flemingia macrophylla TaxID=520843 RepID=A0ABD1M3W2_9FABA
MEEANVEAPAPLPTPTPGGSNGGDNTPLSLSPKARIVSVASNIASQPLHNPNPRVWGVLTAISNNARKRHQGINILLTDDEHCIGRLVEDVRCQIDSNSVSAKHCRIYKMRVTNENMENATSVFLRDTSTNGTYLNWEKLKKHGAALKVCHGDIISFAAPPQHDLAFAFVYRDVLVSTPVPDNAVAKRKAEDFVSENKRLKGLGIGAPEGPISLDDFRSLQRSNTELRKQLENHVVTIDTLRSDHRAAVERHESELKSVKDSVANCYLDQLKELQYMMDLKQKELGDLIRASAEQKHALEDLNERLSASTQSCAEANAIISSQKVNIAELKEQLDEERGQRKEEREKAAGDLKAAVCRAQSEAQEELKRLSDAGLRRERELQEAINKLQESEREMSLLVETLRSKLEDTRQKLVASDNKVRQLETQVHEEKLATENEKKKVELEQQETRRLRKELESEKAAREEAWSKVSVLELEINAAMRDLDFERRRLKASRERLMLRETQLRAFYSTTEEIQILFAKQQEQLKSMQRTLEDEENYENTSVEMDGVIGGTSGREKEVDGYHSQNVAKAGSTTSAQKLNRDHAETSSNEASVTEKHDCDLRSEECQNTQEAEFTSADRDRCLGGGFGSATMCVDGDTMQINDDDDDNNVQETEEHTQIPSRGTPSVYGENESQKGRDNNEGSGALDDSNFVVAESQSTSDAAAVARQNERRALKKATVAHPTQIRRVVAMLASITHVLLLAEDVAKSRLVYYGPYVVEESSKQRDRANSDSGDIYSDSESNSKSNGGVGVDVDLEESCDDLFQNDSVRNINKKKVDRGISDSEDESEKLLSGPIIRLDGCFLKGYYGGQILSAIGKDPNDQMLPICFSVVAGETRESWE